jgi:hypothetical protein
MTTDHKPMAGLAQRLRDAATKLRTKPMPLSDFIPLLQQAADALEAASRPSGDVEALMEAVLDYGSSTGAFAAASAAGLAYLVPGHRIKAKEQFSAIRALAGRLAATASIPAGYVLVPKEPTEDMRVAGVDAYNAHNSAMFFYVWKAMIAAAPQPQPAGVPQQARVGDDRRSKVIRFALFRFAHDAHSMANEAAQDISGLRYKPGAAEAFMRDAEDAQAILADMRSASPIAPASQPAEAPRMLTPGELIDAGVLVSSGAMADIALRVQFKFMSVNAGRTIPAEGEKS